MQTKDEFAMSDIPCKHCGEMLELRKVSGPHFCDTGCLFADQKDRRKKGREDDHFDREELKKVIRDEMELCNGNIASVLEKVVNYHDLGEREDLAEIMYELGRESWIRPEGLN